MTSFFSNALDGSLLVGSWDIPNKYSSVHPRTSHKVFIYFNGIGFAPVSQCEI